MAVPRTLALVTAVLVSACASAWQPGSSSTASVDYGAGVQVNTPVGWYRIDDVSPYAIVLTKNGISIETITVMRAPLGRRLPNSPKRFEDGMTPEAASDVDISNHEFAPGIDGFNVLDRGTATVDGHACYHYTAPAETRFPQFLPTFDALVAAARISDGATPG